MCCSIPCFRSSSKLDINHEVTALDQSTAITILISHGDLLEKARLTNMTYTSLPNLIPSTKPAQLDGASRDMQSRDEGGFS